MENQQNIEFQKELEVLAVNKMDEIEKIKTTLMLTQAYLIPAL
jgi:hypothetical protein